MSSVLAEALFMGKKPLKSDPPPASDPKERLHDVIKTAWAKEQRFTKAINDADTLGAVIRGQLYIDEINMRLITYEKMPNHKDYELEEKTSGHLNMLVYSLGLVDFKLYTALNKFTKIRNEFAHDLERDLEPQEVANFITSIKTSRAAEPFGHFLDEAKEKHGTLDLKQKMAVCINALRQGLLQQESEMRNQAFLLPNEIGSKGYLLDPHVRNKS